MHQRVGSLSLPYPFLSSAHNSVHQRIRRLVLLDQRVLMAYSWQGIMQEGTRFTSLSILGCMTFLQYCLWFALYHQVICICLSDHHLSSFSTDLCHAKLVSNLHHLLIEMTSFSTRIIELKESMIGVESSGTLLIHNLSSMLLC